MLVPTKGMNGANTATANGSQASTSKFLLENGQSSFGSDPNYKLPDPEEMMDQIKLEISKMKVEANKLLGEMEKANEGLEETRKEAKEVRKKTQIEKLKGNELIKLSRLIRLGFDEDIMKAHIEKTNKKLEKELKQKEKDVKNVEVNIEKMVAMNRQCEQACTGAQGAYNQLVVTHQKLQSSLDDVELTLYAEESQVKLKTNMKSVEITTKDTFKKAMQGIIRIIKDRSHDDKLVREVLKIAGRVMSADLKMADDDEDSSSVSSASSVSISSASSDSS